MGASKIVIKLYDESFKIHALNIKYNDFIGMCDFLKTADKLDEPLSTALLNVNYYKLLPIDKYTCIDDLIFFSIGGLIHNSKARIEIKRGGKFLAKFNLVELFNPQTLFPLFNTSVYNLNPNLKTPSYLLEKQVGMIGVYNIDTAEFDINKLHFQLINMNYLNEKYQIMTIIRYDEKVLKTVKSDSLITYRHCVPLT